MTPEPYRCEDCGVPLHNGDRICGLCHREVMRSLERRVEVPSKSRQKGDRAERELKHILEAAGYLVIRSAGSLGPFDLLAITPRRGRWAVYGINVKAGFASPSQAERVRTSLLESEYPVTAIFASRPDRSGWRYWTSDNKPFSWEDKE